MPKKSQKHYKEALNYLVGGVNSPLRAFKPVGGDPLFIAAGQGARVKDVDGREYIDYVQSYGALILGHAHPKVMTAVKKALAGGSTFGSATVLEIELAKEIHSALPSIERIRFTNSGTEGAAGAMKLAKDFSGRPKILKFRECYHGWTEQPYLEAQYNNLDSVRALLSDEVAAVIVEPVAGNSRVILPAAGFLAGLRELCDQNGSLLIFDEVITGFRVARGGAQGRFGVKPDLTVLGKIIGGGFPIGAFGGRADIMQRLAPSGPVYQAGTFSGNPITMTAGLTTLKILREKKIYQKLEARAKALVQELDCPTVRIGSLFGFKMQKDEFKDFFWKMIERGIYFAPAVTEANFVSLAHSDKIIAETIGKVR